MSTDLIRFVCPSCEARLSVNAAFAGKRVRCKKCGSATEVPHPEPMPAFSASEPDDFAAMAGQAAAGPQESFPQSSDEPDSPPPFSDPGTRRSSASRSLPIPDYSFIRLLGRVHMVLGVLCCVVAVIWVVVVIYADFATRNEAGVGGGLVAAAIAALPCLMGGIYCIVLAQFIYAFRDIARNSWYLQLLR